MLFGQKAAIPSLAGSYRAFFPIGAAVDGNTIISQSDLLTSQVNSVVAENDMKWDIIHPRPGNDASSYDFSRADSIVAFAGSNGMTVRGHNFVWHQQVPAWVFQGDGMGAGQASKTEVLARMKGHIETLLAHFHGKVYCWDVVNEALSDGFETWRSDSPWFRAAGSDEDGDGVPDYIVKAFQFARQADPAVKLFYNDYGIESGAKREKAYALARLLKDKGLIDGVGIQGHWSIYSPDAETVRAGIRRIASLGLEVQITELDLSAYGQGDSSALGGLPPRLEDMQAARYGELFRVFREESGSRGLSAVTFWGIADDHTWLDNFPVKGRKDWPLLFDAANGPKKAFWSVAQW
jgi:endo-1,4-beta-xylanase